MKMVKDLENKSCEKWLRELGLSSLENSMLRGDNYRSLQLPERRL